MSVATETAPVGVVAPNLAYRGFILLILSLVAATSTLDRYIIAVLVESIKVDLNLSDTQIGLLTGLAFAIVYTFGCIPLARLADQTSRRGVITACITLWSVMTILCGMAMNFWQMFLARMGVGLGEAGNSAPSQALIADIFPQKQRATAMSIFLLGPPIGMGLGLGVGGWVLQEYGWRTALVLAGLPGLVLAPIVWFVIRDVRKGQSDGATEDVPLPPFLETVKTLMSIRTLPYLIVASAITTLIGMGLANWFPAFLKRTHDIGEAEAGARLALAMPLASILGHILGGPLFDLLGRWKLRAQMFIPVVTTSVAVAAALMVLHGPKETVYIFIALLIFSTGLFAAPLFAAVTTIAPIWARATAVACLMFAINLVGLGVGPAIVGAISDVLAPRYGDASLQWAMTWTLILAAPALLIYYLVTRHYVEDLRTAQERLGRTLAAE